jgi:hypothetical protein
LVPFVLGGSIWDGIKGMLFSSMFSAGVGLWRVFWACLVTRLLFTGELTLFSFGAFGWFSAVLTPVVGILIALLIRFDML